MLVISVTECPPALRGDLSRWLLEIDTGVYIGQVSQRVREELWKRVTAHLKSGKAIMVYTARNEQRLDFRIHNAAWEPIDFDGLKLMLRPDLRRKQQKHLEKQEPIKPGYSTASKMLLAKRAARSQARSKGLPDTFAILDVETTGLNAKKHHILELGALKIHQAQVTERIQFLIAPVDKIPDNIQQLTGLTEDLLHRQGVPLAQALPAFMGFLADLPLVSHNIMFDLEFLQHACAQHGLPIPNNRRIDTLALARRHVPQAKDHKLTTLLEHFELPYPRPHRSLEDCQATHLLLNKLIEIREGSG